MHKRYALAIVLSLFTYTHGMEENTHDRPEEYRTVINLRGEAIQIKVGGKRHPGVTVLIPTSKTTKISEVECFYPGNLSRKKLMSDKLINELVKSGEARKDVRPTITRLYF